MGVLRLIVCYRLRARACLELELSMGFVSVRVQTAVELAMSFWGEIARLELAHAVTSSSDDKLAEG